MSREKNQKDKEKRNEEDKIRDYVGTVRLLLIDSKYNAYLD